MLYAGARGEPQAVQLPEARPEGGPQRSGGEGGQRGGGGRGEQDRSGAGGGGRDGAAAPSAGAHKGRGGRLHDPFYLLQRSEGMAVPLYLHAEGKALV